MEVIEISAGLKFKRRKGSYAFAVAFSLFVFFIILLCFILTPIIKNAAEAELARYAEKLVSDAAASIPDDLFSSLKETAVNEEGMISSVSLNPEKVNKIRNLFSEAIFSEFDGGGRTAFYVRVGSLTGNVFLSGRGPAVKLYAVVSGAVKCDLVSTFSSAGINQTRHTVYIEAQLSLRALVPFSSTVETRIKIPVSETVTVGSVPSFYAEGR